MKSNGTIRMMRPELESAFCKSWNVVYGGAISILRDRHFGD